MIKSPQDHHPDVCSHEMRGSHLWTLFSTISQEVLHSKLSPHLSVDHTLPDSRLGWGKSHPAPGQSALAPPGMCDLPSALLPLHE